MTACFYLTANVRQALAYTAQGEKAASLSEWLQSMAKLLVEAGHLPPPIDPLRAQYYWKQLAPETWKEEYKAYQYLWKFAVFSPEKPNEWTQLSATYQGEQLYAHLRSYREHLRATGQSDDWDLVTALATSPVWEALPALNTLYCDGFFEFQPFFQRILAALRLQGVEVAEVSHPKRSEKPKLYSFENQASQWITAIHSLKAYKKQHPKARVALVVPGLETQSLYAERMLSYCYDRDAFLQFQSRDEKAFSLSVGKALADYAAVEALMRAIGYHWGLVYTHNESNYFTKPISVCKPLGKKHLSQWTDALVHFANEQGYPGELPVSSLDYQAIERLYAVILNNAATDVVLEPMTVAEYYAQFCFQLENILFQGKSDDTSFQCIGLLEASLLPCDMMWVVNTSALTWPERGLPNAYIPLAIQKKYKLPHASFAREALIGQALQESLEASSSNLVFSYVGLAAGNRVAPSVLHQHCALEAIAQTDSLYHHMQAAFQAPIFQPTPEVAFPSYSQGQAIQGGAGLLQSAYNCLFQSQMRYRLKLQRTEAQQWLGFAVFGKLLHEILYTLQKEPQRAMDEVVAFYVQLEPRPPLIQDWLVKRLIAAANHAKTQLAAYQVCALEKKYTQIPIGSLYFDLRLDALYQEGEVKHIIDYKAKPLSKLKNEVGTREWQNIQLFVYAYAVLHAREEAPSQSIDAYHLAFLACDYQAEETGFHRFEGDYSDYFALLEQLATAFASGVADAKPRHNSLCQRCDYRALCRSFPY